MKMSHAVVVVTFLMQLCKPAEACSYLARPIEEHIDNAAIIFVARVLEVAVRDQGKGSDRSEDAPVRARFRVVDTIKGDPSKVQYLRSGYGMGDCGVPFLIGGRYLVFTDSGGFVVIVTGSRHVTPESEPDRKLIEAMKKYVAHGTKIPQTSNPSVQPIGKKPRATDREP